MGSSLNRLLQGRLKYSKGPRDPMRDVVLAGCIGVFFYSLQGPELVDRWMWLPFMLALCFRNPAPPRPAVPVDGLREDVVPRNRRRAGARRGTSAAGWAATPRPISSPSAPPARRRGRRSRSRTVRSSGRVRDVGHAPSAWARCSTTAFSVSTAPTCSWSAPRPSRRGPGSWPRSGAAAASSWTRVSPVAPGRTSAARAGRSSASTSRTRAPRTRSSTSSGSSVPTGAGRSMTPRSTWRSATSSSST